jgi:predicted acetyltransferase
MYELGTLDVSDTSEEGRARQRAWLAAVTRGFHGGRPQAEYEQVWRDHVAADDVVCRGVWLREGEFGAGPVPVATFSSLDKTLNTGLGLLPLRMVVDVTTSPAHRRRGLVRRLMEQDLADAADRGIPLAALTASEATIYGRWGFGAATFAQTVEVDAGPRFGLRDFRDPGRVELVEPPESWPLIRSVLDRFHRRTRGSVEFPQFYEPLLTGAFGFEGAGSGGPDHQLRGAVHLGADGEVDGLVLYKVKRQDGKRRLEVTMMIAFGPEATLGLWQFLGGIDLVESVTWELAAPDDPLRWALRDINALRTTAVQEFLWVRVLDVVRSLSARPWAAEGTSVLEVVDPQGYAAGRYRVESRDGRATVATTGEAAELRVDAETLGSLYLGGATVEAMRAAGRVAGRDDHVARFAAMADLAVPPYNLTGF